MSHKFFTSKMFKALTICDVQILESQKNIVRFLAQCTYKIKRDNEDINFCLFATGLQWSKFGPPQI